MVLYAAGTTMFKLKMEFASFRTQNIYLFSHQLYGERVRVRMRMKSKQKQYTTLHCVRVFRSYAPIDFVNIYTKFIRSHRA